MKQNFFVCLIGKRIICCCYFSLQSSSHSEKISLASLRQAFVLKNFVVKDISILCLVAVVVGVIFCSAHSYNIYVLLKINNGHTTIDMERNITEKKSLFRRACVCVLLLWWRCCRVSFASSFLYVIFIFGVRKHIMDCYAHTFANNADNLCSLTLCLAFRCVCFYILDKSFFFVWHKTTNLQCYRCVRYVYDRICVKHIFWWCGKFFLLLTKPVYLLDGKRCMRRQ